MIRDLSGRWSSTLGAVQSWFHSNSYLRPLQCFTATLAVAIAYFFYSMDAGAAAGWYIYAVQLNYWGFVGTIGGSILGAGLTQFANWRHWHPRQGRRFVWALVAAVPFYFPLLCVLLSLARFMRGPLDPSESSSATVRLIAEPQLTVIDGAPAEIIIALGAIWIAWVSTRCLEFALRLQLETEELSTELKQPETTIVSELGGTMLSVNDLMLAFRISSHASQESKPFGMKLRRLQSLYFECASQLNIPRSVTPRLVVSRSETYYLSGPCTIANRKRGSTIILPEDLGSYYQRNVDSAFCEPRPNLAQAWTKTDERICVVESIRLILLHELSHFRSKDHRVRWLREYAFILFPMSWIVMRYTGVYRRLGEAIENACDADMMTKAQTTFSFVAHAMDNLFDVLRERRSIAVTNVFDYGIGDFLTLHFAAEQAGRLVETRRGLPKKGSYVFSLMFFGCALALLCLVTAGGLGYRASSQDPRASELPISSDTSQHLVGNLLATINAVATRPVVIPTFPRASRNSRGLDDDIAIAPATFKLLDADSRVKTVAHSPSKSISIRDNIAVNPPELPADLSINGAGVVPPVPTSKSQDGGAIPFQSTMTKGQGVLQPKDLIREAQQVDAANRQVQQVNEANRQAQQMNQINQMNQLGRQVQQQMNQLNQISRIQQQLNSANQFQQQLSQMNQINRMTQMNQQQTNQMNQMNQLNRMNQMNQQQTNQMNQMNQLNRMNQMNQQQTNQMNQMNQLNRMNQQQMNQINQPRIPTPPPTMPPYTPPRF